MLQWNAGVRKLSPAHYTLFFTVSRWIDLIPELDEIGCSSYHIKSMGTLPIILPFPSTFL